MTYELAFVEDALAQWRRLDGTVKQQLKKKIAERLQAPRVPASQLSGHKDRHKIKPRSIGCHPVYEVRNTKLLVLLTAVGKRDRNAVLRASESR